MNSVLSRSSGKGVMQPVYSGAWGHEGPPVLGRRPSAESMPSTGPAVAAWGQDPGYAMPQGVPSVLHRGPGGKGAPPVGAGPGPGFKKGAPPVGAGGPGESSMTRRRSAESFFSTGPAVATWGQDPGYSTPPAAGGRGGRGNFGPPVPPGVPRNFGPVPVGAGGAGAPGFGGPVAAEFPPPPNSGPAPSGGWGPGGQPSPVPRGQGFPEAAGPASVDHVGQGAAAVGGVVLGRGPPAPVRAGPVPAPAPVAAPVPVPAPVPTPVPA